MPRGNRAPELTFQQHIAECLVREHKDGVLEQSDITDSVHSVTEDQLWAFLKATQAGIGGLCERASSNGQIPSCNNKSS